MSGAFRQRAVRVVLGLALVVITAGHVAGYWRIGLVEALEQWCYDVQTQLTMPQTPHASVVIVEIDPLGSPGRADGSWGRDRIGKLVERLVDRHGAAAVAFDAAFEGADGSSGLPVLEQLASGELSDDRGFKRRLAALRFALDLDGRLARALATRPTVLGYQFIDPTAVSGALPSRVPLLSPTDPRLLKLGGWSGYRANLPQLQASAAAAGHLNVLADTDAAIRRVPLLLGHAGGLYEAFALAAIRAAWKIPAGPLSLGTIDSSGGRLATIGIGPFRIPVDATGAALVPYRSARNGVERRAAEEFESDRLSEDSLKGKLVIVSTVAGSRVATPMDSSLPMAEFQANLIAGIVDGTVKAPPESARIYGLALIGTLGIVLALWLPAVTSMGMIAIVIGALLVAGVSALTGWHIGHMVIPVGAALAMIVGQLLINLWFGAALAAWHRRRLRLLYGAYVAPGQVGQMANDPDPTRFSSEGRNEVLTVMFADLRNFTAFAEALEPDRVRGLLVDYLTEMSDVVHQYGGTVDKYMGDSVMAFWGAPVPDADHATNAVRASLAMQRAVRNLGQRLARAGAERGTGELSIGIGLNTGLVSVGDMGSRLRRTYTVIGDAVNLASRLESLTKYYGVGIIIGERTRELVPNLVCRELDRVRVKGRDEIVAIHEPIGVDGELDSKGLDRLALWRQLLVAYRNRRWTEAEAMLDTMRRADRTDRRYETLYELYAVRIARYRIAALLDDWDGVTVFDRK